MAKRCPRPGCQEYLKTARRSVQTLNKKEAIGSKSNPMILRCAKCRKDFEFKGGKVTLIPRR